MLHSYSRIFVHLVWSVNHRKRILTKEIRPIVFKHIAQYSTQNNIALEALSIQIDHVHALVNLRSNQKVEEIVKLLKGESSHWINQCNLVPETFSWQRGYGAFSVSPSHFHNAKTYIEHQDQHHQKKPFGEEFEGLLRKYGFESAKTDESVRPDELNLSAPR